MSPIMWIILALIIAGALIFVSSLKTRRSLPALELPEGETLPLTVMQKRASWALFVVVLLVGTAAGCVAWFGPQVWWDNDAVRHPVTALLLGALIVYMFFVRGARALELRDDGSFDERDAAILNRSCAGVGGAMMVVLAAWMVGLIEAHIEIRLVPAYFLYLIFWSCVMTNVIASLGAILLAYRRS